ncbi:hypothetical protein BJ165DRAFT_360492 [Panaeolus papilionaceus]|nr:hypothetical protein BJ165DRAFT_360492 [Panaeolus papilionaceus]
MTMLRRQQSPYPGTPGVPDGNDKKYKDFGGYPGPAHIMHAVRAPQTHTSPGGDPKIYISST